MGDIKGIGIEIVPGYNYKKLTAKWYWNTPNGRVWKCTCSCGAACYVEEWGLQLHTVRCCPDCEASGFQAKKEYRKTLPKHKKRKKQEVPYETR